jgi:hypothetical protein
MPDREVLEGLARSQLIDLLEDAAKNWLAHDGVWFQAVERRFGMEAAIACDADAWERFTIVEARRIMDRLGIAAGGGLEALERALRFRLYARINEQSIRRVDERTLHFEMNACRVQDARKRKGLPDFPCKSVGLFEYAGFARTIDPRLETHCLTCPPDPHPQDCWCAWEFTLPLEPVPGARGGG